MSKMDWNGTFRSFVSRPEPCLNFLYNFNYDQYPGMEMKHLGLAEAADHGLVPAAMDKNRYNNQEKKKRLTSEQLDSLEMSFQEEIKLDPDRKMKLSRELGLQPRQIAVWFQNRRARWKAKELERLYDALKQEFDVISREKQKLQDEVPSNLPPSMKTLNAKKSPTIDREHLPYKSLNSVLVMNLKAMLREQATRNQVSTGYTEISGEETVESSSIRSSNKPRAVGNHPQPIAESNYVFNADEYNPAAGVAAAPYWTTVQLPSYP